MLFIIEALRKTYEQCYPDKIDACKESSSIPDISMTYIFCKSLKKDKKLKLHAAGGICHVCRDINEKSFRTVVAIVVNLQVLLKCECQKAAV